MSRLVWDWTTAAFALLAANPCVCDLDPHPRMLRVLEAARRLGVLPTDVLTVADHMARDPREGTVKLYAARVHPAPTVCHGFDEQPEPDAKQIRQPRQRPPKPTAKAVRRPVSHAPKAGRAAPRQSRKKRPRRG